MANTVTASTLWSRALDYADMTGSSFPDANRQYDLLNAAVAELHYTLAQSDSEYVVGTPSTINVTAGTGTYALPTDFYKCLKVYRVEGNRRYVVRRFEREEADGILYVPSTAATLEMHYIPHAVLMTAGSDVINANYPPGFEDFVAMHVACKLLMKEESAESAMVLGQERDKLLQKIISMFAPQRDIGQPGHITDVYGRYRDPWRGVIDGPGVQEQYYRIEGGVIRVIEADPAGFL